MGLQDTINQVQADLKPLAQSLAVDLQFRQKELAQHPVITAYLRTFGTRAAARAAFAALVDPINAEQDTVRADAKALV